MKARATKLGWADRATGGGDGKWVSRGSHQCDQDGLATSKIKMGLEASWRHGLTTTRRGHGWRRRRRGWVGLSHSLSCLSILCLASHSPFPFLFFFFFPCFFYFLRLVLDYWLLRAEFFFFNRFTWVMGSWTSRMMGWGGGFMIFGWGPELKTKGGPSPFFFWVLWKFYQPKKNFFFGPREGPGPLWAQRGSVRAKCIDIIDERWASTRYIVKNMEIKEKLKRDKGTLPQFNMFAAA